ncbi:hypothetical protein GJAV_G00237010 [Gymnothorax javanicus]|nr:hypothetical protein GJAV_G00237010 [Gymnothorax javanicus]
MAGLTIKANGCYFGTYHMLGRSHAHHQHVTSLQYMSFLTQLTTATDVVPMTYEVKHLYDDLSRHCPEPRLYGSEASWSHGGAVWIVLSRVTRLLGGLPLDPKYVERKDGSECKRYVADT